MFPGVHQGRSPSLPHLGEAATAFTPWFGEPCASGLEAYVLLVFEQALVRLTLLCRATTVLAIHCRYTVAPPEWPVMQADARRFRPRRAWQRWRVRAVPRADGAGWTLAQRGVPTAALHALAAS